MHEGIPILNFLVPKEFIHDNGRLTGMTVREGRAPSTTPRAAASSCPPASPTSTSHATTCWSRSARRTPSPGSSATSASSSTSGTCRRSTRRPWARPTRRCSSAATRRSGRRTSSGRWRTATRPRCRSTSCCSGEDVADRPLPAVEVDQPEDGHPRVELRQRHLRRPPLPGAAARQGDRARRHQGGGRARLRRPRSRSRRRERCLNCDVQTVFTASLCIECDACVDICPMDCITFTAERRRGRPAPPPQGAGAEPDPGHLRRRRPQDRPHHGQGRGRLPALRAVRRALSHRRLGHEEIPH